MFISTALLTASNEGSLLKQAYRILAMT